MILLLRTFLSLLPPSYLNMQCQCFKYRHGYRSIDGRPIKKFLISVAESRFEVSTQKLIVLLLLYTLFTDVFAL